MFKSFIEFVAKFKRVILVQWLGIPTKSKYKFILKDWVSLTDLQACQKVLETKRFSRNLVPVQIEKPDAKKLLVIAPHQDDDIFGAGGTLIKAVESGSEVHVVYVADHENAQQADLVYNETKEVCNTVGTTPHFLKAKMGKIPLTSQHLNDSLLSIIKELQPEIIFTSFLLDDHDDHRRVNELLLHVLKQNKLLNCDIWAYQVYSSIIPNVVVDITEQSQRKRDVMEIWKHVSGQRDWPHYILGMNAVNSRWISSKTPKFVEAFFVVPIQEYLDLCRLYFESSFKCYYGEYYLRNTQQKDLQKKPGKRKKINNGSPPDDIYPLF